MPEAKLEFADYLKRPPRFLQVVATILKGALSFRAVDGCGKTPLA